MFFKPFFQLDKPVGNISGVNLKSEKASTKNLGSCSRNPYLPPGDFDKTVLVPDTCGSNWIALRIY